MSATFIDHTASTWVEVTRNKARLIASRMASLKQYVGDVGGDDSLFNKLSTDIYAQLEKLYSEELPLSYALDTSDLIFRLEGTAITDGNPRASIIVSQFTKVRTQVSNVVKAISGISHAHAISAEDVDLGVAAVAHGSLILGFTAIVPSVESHAKQLRGFKAEEDPIYLATRRAIREIGIVTECIDDPDFSHRIETEIPDPAIRDAAVIAVEEFSPSPKSGIDRVSIGARKVSIEKMRVLTSENRKMLRKLIRRPSKKTEKQTFLGVIREMDLDARRFELRHVKGYPKVSLRTAYDESFSQAAERWLNKKVEIHGEVEKLPDGTPRLLIAQKVRVIKESENGRLEFKNGS